MTTEFHSAAAILPVRDLDAATDRYRALGFTVRAYEGPDPYAFADRGPVSLHLAQFAGHDPATAASAVYLYVADADAVHAEWTAAGVGGHLHPPGDTPWGLREFSYVDPDGTLHRVGSFLTG